MRWRIEKGECHWMPCLERCQRTSHDGQVAHTALQVVPQIGGDALDGFFIAIAWIAESIANVHTNAALVDRGQSENNSISHG